MQFGENQSEKPPVYRKTNIIPFILLLFIVAAVASLVYLKTQGVDLRNMSIKDLTGLTGIFRISSSPVALNKSSEIKYSSKEHVAFTAFNDFLVTCTRDNIRFIDKKGNELKTIPVSMNSPVFSTNSAWLLAADIGGKEVALFDRNDKKWTGAADGNIINAAVGNNGDVALVHEAKGYKSALTVYDRNGHRRFSTQFAERFVLGAEISPSGKNILVSFIDASGVYTNSMLEIIDIYGERSGEKAVRESDVYIAAHFLKDDSYIAVSSKEMEYYDRNGSKKWTATYEEGIISTAVFSGNYAALASKKASGTGILAGIKSEVRIFNGEGKEVHVEEINGEVRNIEAYEDILAVNTGNEVIFLNLKGKLLGKYSSEIEINSIHFFSGQEAAVISKNTAVIIKI